MLLEENNISLELLWSNIRDGNGEALERLFHHTSQELFNYGMYFTRDRERVQHSIQSLFVYLWEHKTTLSQPVSVKNYLLKAFRNTLLKQSKPATIDFLTPSFEASTEYKIIAREEASLLKETLRKALSHLSNRQKEIVFLRFYEKKSTEEIAEIMEITPKATYKLLARALQVLRKEIGVVRFVWWFI
ncbi:MAG: sigma-70 family RNA polymerase sigma factor [Chitinophagaceae bacterium]